MLFKKPTTKPKTSSKTWPQDGDVYFWVRSDIGMICHSEWADDGPYHQFRKDTGNCFRTRADAIQGKKDCIKYISQKGSV